MTNKRLLTISLIALVILIGFFVRLWLAQNNNLSLIDAIDPDTPVFFEIKEGPQQWNELHRDSIWSSLVQFDIINRIDHQLILQDSLFSLSKKDKLWLHQSKFFISLDKISAVDYGLVFYYDRRGMPSIDRKAWGDYLDSPVLKRLYKGVGIFDFRLETGENLSIAQYRNILLVSLSDVLIERAIRQISGRNHTLEEDADFRELSGKGNKNQDIKAYINFQSIASLLGVFLNEDGRNLVKNLSGFAGKAMLDISLTEHNMILNGYVSHSREDQVLLQIPESENSKVNPARVLPVNTAVFYSKNTAVLSANDSSNDSSISKIRDLYFRNWMDASGAFAITEPFNQSFEENCLLVLSCADTALARQQLSSLAALQADVNQYIPEHFEHTAFWQIEDFDDLEQIAGFSSTLIRNPWFCIVDDFVVFANNIANLKVLINRYEAGQVLHHDLDYRAFEDQVSNQAICNLYVNTKRCELLVKRFYNSERAQDVNHFNTLLQLLNPLAIQFSSFTKQLKLVYALIQSSSGFQESNTLLWKCQLDTLMQGRPYFLKNHQTGQFEILVQDCLNQIYLIDRSGQILWKRELPAAIKGQVYQIDFYHNRKLQMLFSTEKSIELIDRKGRDVENYPLRLPAKASSGLALIDYDGRKEYRMFVACMDKKIYGFQMSGSPLPGWNPLTGTGVLSQPLKHLLACTKDYNYCFNKDGKLFYFNRKGALRINPIQNHTRFKQAFSESVNDDGSFVLSNIDTAGLMYRINEKGKLAIDTFSTFAKPVSALTIPNKQGLQWAVNDEEGLHFFDEQLMNSGHWNYPEDMSGDLFYASDNNPEAGLGIINADSTAVYLLRNAEPAEGFPIRGITVFRMFDLFDDGNPVLILGTADATVSAYRIRK